MRGKRLFQPLKMGSFSFTCGTVPIHMKDQQRGGSCQLASDNLDQNSKTHFERTISTHRPIQSTAELLGTNRKLVDALSCWDGLKPDNKLLGLNLAF